MKGIYLKKNNKLILGQSLFEVVMAVGLVTLIMVSVVALAALSIRNVTFSKNQTLATQYSQEALEWLRGIRDADWDSFHEKAEQGMYCISSLSFGPTGIACSGDDMIPGTLFAREVVFTIKDNGADPDDEIDAKVSVFWVDGAGYHEVSSMTTFTDWKSVN